MNSREEELRQCSKSLLDVSPGNLLCYLIFDVLYIFSLQEDLGLPESTYELCYNAACALIGQGQLTESFNKLRQAEGQSHSVLPASCVLRSSI